MQCRSAGSCRDPALQPCGKPPRALGKLSASAQGCTGAGGRNQPPVSAGSNLQPAPRAQETIPVPSRHRLHGRVWVRCRAAEEPRETAPVQCREACSSTGAWKPVRRGGWQRWLVKQAPRVGGLLQQPCTPGQRAHSPRWGERRGLPHHGSAALSGVRVDRARCLGRQNESPGASAASSAAAQPPTGTRRPPLPVPQGPRAVAPR